MGENKELLYFDFKPIETCRTRTKIYIWHRRRANSKGTFQKGSLKNLNHDSGSQDQRIIIYFCPYRKFQDSLGLV